MLIICMNISVDRVVLGTSYGVLIDPSKGCTAENLRKYTLEKYEFCVGSLRLPITPILRAEDPHVFRDMLLYAEKKVKSDERSGNSTHYTRSLYTPCLL